MDADSPKISDVRFAAMNFLAMREHSIKELKEKLGRKYAAWPSLIDSVIIELAEQNLQSDERFTMAFVVMRQRQGKGSQLIRFELRERGIDSELVALYVDDTDHQWQALACEVRRKRFGDEQPKHQRERARQMRFLHARGFSSPHIKHAFNADGVDCC